MGAEISFGHGYVEAKVKDELKGAEIYLDFPSVGATENIMTAAALAKGTTTIENAAKEPEIVDLANFINAMGGRVIGAGTDTIRIEGMKELKGCEHYIIPDRIEAGTFMVASAITRGDVFIENAVPEHMTALIAKMREMGVEIIEEGEGLRVRANDPLKAVDIKTMPHPGFPTDMQSQVMALMLTAKGTSIITETVFENRFMHVEEFRHTHRAAKQIEEIFLALVGFGFLVIDIDLTAAFCLYGFVFSLTFGEGIYGNFRTRVRTVFQRRPV